MGERNEPPLRRRDVRDSLHRDLERRKRREHGGRVWQALALIGSVGWPIVLLSTGGAFLGRACDHRWNSGVRFTLMLVAMGASVGTWIAFRTIQGDKR